MFSKSVRYCVTLVSCSSLGITKGGDICPNVRLGGWSTVLGGNSVGIGVGVSMGFGSIGACPQDAKTTNTSIRTRTVASLEVL